MRFDCPRFIPTAAQMLPKPRLRPNYYRRQAYITPQPFLYSSAYPTAGIASFFIRLEVRFF